MMDHQEDSAPLILASASPRRRELLQSLVAEFKIIPSHAPELHDEVIGAVRLCETNAALKAEDIAAHNRESVVIGADTLVTLNGRIFGKPKNLHQAMEMLGLLAGHTHEVVTGVCLVHFQAGRREVFSETTSVTFRPLSRETISTYLSRVSVLDKAGAYAIQEHGEMLIERISGSRTNVIGLPLEKLESALRNWGYSIRNR
jgi:septum formation protein